MSNAIANLKKAYQAQAITEDTFTLQKYFHKFENDEVAEMMIVGIESKYLPKYDKRDLPDGVEGAGSLGYRTRFILQDGSTVGTFSNAARNFFSFFAGIMGHTEEMPFLHIDIKGEIKINVSRVELDKGKGTYNFDIVEEGSNLQGLTDYLPNAQNILQLDSGTKVDTETGEIEE